MKTLLLIFTITLLLQAESLKDIKFKDTVVSKVTSIYDGDTFRANIKGYPDIIGHRISIRVNGIDTPEIRGKCLQEKNLARQAKQLTVSLLRNAKTVELRNMKRGKYFRIVADVYVDDINLGSKLIEQELAVSYDGGHKSKDWCK